MVSRRVARFGSGWRRCSCPTGSTLRRPEGGGAKPIAICGDCDDVPRRGVIFVDLALAQVAALGATVGLLVGAEPGGAWSYLCSLGFTMVGALLFTGARHLGERLLADRVVVPRLAPARGPPE